MKKTFLRLTCAALLLLILLPTTLSCGQRPPALEDIYDEAVALIEASFALNDIAFGQGLPVWDLDSSYAVYMQMYQNKPSYVQVKIQADIAGVDQIKSAMEAVYSTDYLTSLYGTLFDGYAYEEGAMIAQYHEDETRLYRRRSYDPLLEGGQRIYDYATLQVVGGNEDYVLLTVDTHLEHEDSVLEVELALVREENGWRLDTPTY